MFAITVFSLVILLFSIIIHEIAHGSVALFLGDSTAKREGRLTLNPLKHLDLFGSIILPLFLLLATRGQGPIFGWAKPVPVNAYNLKDQKWGMIKVSLAGPAANFAVAILFGLVIRFIDLPQALLIPFTIITVYNFLWALFNLLPIPPLDGSHIIFSFFPRNRQWMDIKNFLYQYGTIILIFFIFFGIGFLSDIATTLFRLVAGASPLM
ncbi:MAG: site-2 protease family protein [Candidatus Paceibacterota bacterium]